MANLTCPECGGRLIYDPATRHYTCTSCGLYVSKEQLYLLRDKKREEAMSRRSKSSRYQEYLEWWSSKKKSRF